MNGQFIRDDASEMSIVVCRCTYILLPGSKRDQVLLVLIDWWILACKHDQVTDEDRNEQQS